MTLKSTFRSVITLGKGLVKGLSELEAGDDPIRLFGQWFEDAADAGLIHPDAMTLATATPDGAPSARMVLLKGFDDRGFVFYTNYASRKARELEENPRASLVVHWAPLERQVRIEGTVARVSRDEAAAYFGTRPRGSRIGAWASRQSEPLEDRSVLEGRFRDYEEEFRDGDVPLPEFWGGYRVAATRIEFWQGRANRLHDRLRYDRAGDDSWQITRLYP